MKLNGQFKWRVERSSGIDLAYTLTAAYLTFESVSNCWFASKLCEANRTVEMSWGVLRPTPETIRRDFRSRLRTTGNIFTVQRHAFFSSLYFYATSDPKKYLFQNPALTNEEKKAMPGVGFCTRKPILWKGNPYKMKLQFLTSMQEEKLNTNIFWNKQNVWSNKVNTVWKKATEQCIHETSNLP